MIPTKSGYESERFMFWRPDFPRLTDCVVTNQMFCIVLALICDQIPLFCSVLFHLWALAMKITVVSYREEIDQRDAFKRYFQSCLTC